MPQKSPGTLCDKARHANPASSIDYRVQPGLAVTGIPMNV
jgi:hypothetical protein